MFSEIAEIALVAARLGQFLQFLKTRVILILNFTRPMRLPILKTDCGTTGAVDLWRLKVAGYSKNTPNFLSRAAVRDDHQNSKSDKSTAMNKSPALLKLKARFAFLSTDKIHARLSLAPTKSTTF